MMLSSKALLSASNLLYRRASLNGSIGARYRCMATEAAEANPTLPLAGTRVLDMTRVLAGVCSVYLYKYDQG